METNKVYQMPLAKVYPLLVAKAERKGRSESEVRQIVQWLTGYTPGQLTEILATDITYGDFFQNAPQLNPDRLLIKGTVCGVRVEIIAELEKPRDFDPFGQTGFAHLWLQYD